MRPGISLRRGCAFVVGVVDMLDYGFAVMDDMRVRDVVHEEEQIIGAGAEVLIDLCKLRWILADVAGAGSDGAVHADSGVAVWAAGAIASEPLAPAVALGGFDAGTEVVAEDVGEGADAEVAGVLLVGMPGLKLEVVDRGDDLGIVAEGEARP
jgi:hypothetical protein